MCLENVCLGFIENVTKKGDAEENLTNYKSKCGLYATLFNLKL